MFRPIRRKKQQLPDDEARQILEKGSFGIVSVLGDDGYPYGVPVNYVVIGETVYFHCAHEGHKLDAIKACDKVSFTVVEKSTVLPADFATSYLSVIAFCRARIVEDRKEWLDSLTALGDKYNPGHLDDVAAEIEKEGPRTTMVALEIEHIAGKESLDLMKHRAGR